MSGFAVIAAVPTRFDNAMFAVLALVAIVLAVAAFVISFLSGSDREPSRLHSVVGRGARPLAAAIASVAMLGSLYYSEVRHFEPCRWCWYQRVCWYPLAMVLVLSVIRRDGGARRYAWPLASVGLVIASYHHLIERYPDLADESGCSISVPCTAPYFRVWGQITIAAMSVMGFLSILLLLAVDRRWDRRLTSAKDHS